MTEVDLGKTDVKEKITQLKEMLGVGEKRPEEKDTVEPAEPTPTPINWDDYELDPNLRHLYPKAKPVETPEGLKWVVLMREKKTYRGPYETGTVQTHKGVSNQMRSDGYPRAIGDLITALENAPPDEGCTQWVCKALIPGNFTDGAIMVERQMQVVLPDPKRIEKEPEVPPPTEEELKTVEDKALEWAKNA